MKNFKKVLALVLAVVMLLSFATVASAVTSDYYKDTDDIDYNEAVDVLGAIGVLNGFPDDTFRPDATITRAQSAKIIAMFDNGSTDINKLYTAANPFSDCVDHWAESYIAYGVKTGILAGYASGKFLPEENVTGIQFLKMALVVLGYNAKTEGLEGKNWDVNTLALAKRVGLTATLGNKFDYSADLKRQEAAVIMLDALRAETVEYGSTLGVNVAKFEQAIKDWDPSDPFYGVNLNGMYYMTVAGAVKTGELLGKQWKLAEGYTEDAFMRPYRTWELNGDVIGTYMYPAAAEYTTAYTMCDVLVDLGVAKSNTSSARTIDEHFVNGADAYNNLTATYSHNIEGFNVDCHAKDAVGGAQGTLTQVFYMGGGKYRITEIDTWLAEVTATARKSSNRDGHLTTYTVSSIDAIGDSKGYDTCNNRNINEMTNLVTTTEGLSKGDVVLVSISAKTGCTGNAYYVVAAKNTTGAFDGYKLDAYPSQTRIDGEYKNDSLHFHLGYADSKDRTQFGTKLFFFDRYDNVIGMDAPAASAKQYLVIDRLWLTSIDGDPYVYADVVTIDGKTTKKVEVSVYNSVVNGECRPSEFIKWFGDSNGQLSDAFAESNTWAYDELHLYSVNSDGLYYLKEYNPDVYDNIHVITGEPEVNADGNKIFATNAATQYLIHENDGTYTAVTGFRTVDTLTAAHAQIVDNNGDGIAEIVYIYGGVTREGDNSTAYVTGPATNWVEVYNNKDFNKMTIYVEGVATDVYVDADDVAQYFNSLTWNYTNTGFYKFHYLTIGSRTFVQVAEAHDGPNMSKLNTIYTVNGVSGDVLSTNAGYDAIADNVVVYSVRVDGTVVKEDDKYAEAYVVDGALVKLLYNANGEVSAIYVLEDNNY